MNNLSQAQSLPQEDALLAPAVLGQRLHVVDVLRGFALLGILTIHSLQNFLHATTMGLMKLGPKNTFVKTSLEFLIEDKFFIIFSFLFGWSFCLIYQKTVEKNKPFVKLFVWRLVILLGIGIFHSFFYRSDILQVYAMVGFLLIFCRNLSNRTLLFLCSAFFLMTIPCAIYKDQISQYFLDLRQQRIPVPTKLSYSIYSGRLFTTSSMFVLGLYAGRTGIIQRIASESRLLKITVWASGFAVVLMGFGIQLESLNLGLASTGIYVSNAIFYCLQNIAFSCFYVSLLTWLFSQTSLAKSLSWLVPLGRMGLTAYIMQSVFFQLFYIHYDGLEMGLPGALLVTLFFYLGQVVFAEFWFMHFKYGPMEWLWRSLTYLVTDRGYRIRVKR